MKVSESEQVSGTNLNVAALLAVCVPECCDNVAYSIESHRGVAAAIFGRRESALDMRVFVAVMRLGNE